MNGGKKLSSSLPGPSATGPPRERPPVERPKHAGPELTCPQGFPPLPPAKEDAALEAALSFYSSIVTINAEGDSMVSDQTLEGLGTTSSFLIQALFGSLVRLAEPGQQLYPPTSPSGRPSASAPADPSSCSTGSTQEPHAIDSGMRPAAVADDIASSRSPTRSSSRPASSQIRHRPPALSSRKIQSRIAKMLRPLTRPAGTFVRWRNPD